MNIAGMRCANCLVHGWNQLEDKSAMMQCTRCKLIQYCSKECQYEHWSKVHRRQCEYFADPSKCEPWQHNQLDCVICQQAAVVGEANLTNIHNPNYECIHKTFDDAPPELYHAHPFPIAGDPADIREKAVIVLWQLLNKFKLIHPDVARNWEEDFGEVINTLVKERLAVWFNRKIYPQPLAQVSLSRGSALFRILADIHVKRASNESGSMVDPFELWKIIMLVAHIEKELSTCNISQFLKDPLVDISDHTHKMVTAGRNNTTVLGGISNATKYITKANDVLEALSTKIIPYQEVLKIICGGSLEQKCSFCSKDLDIIEDMSNAELHVSSVNFSPLLLGKYDCGGDPYANPDLKWSCADNRLQMVISNQLFEHALKKMAKVRSANVCDFCFKLTPIKEVGSSMGDIHRCSYCRKTMYCSIECLHQDWKIHLNVCHKDREGRKKKMGGKARREVARLKCEEIEREEEEEEEEEEEAAIEKARDEEKEKAREDAILKAIEAIEEARGEGREEAILKALLEEAREKGREETILKVIEEMLEEVREEAREETGEEAREEARKEISEEWGIREKPGT